MPDSRPTPTEALSKMLNRGRRRGWGEVLGLGARRMREWFHSTDTLVMFTRRTGGVVETSDAFHFRETHRADGDAYGIWIGTDTPTTFSHRLSDGNRCFVVTKEDRFVHSSWAATVPVWTRELKRYLSPPPGDAYVYESFTRAEVRGRGIYPLALRNIAARLGDDGIDRLWVAVESHNPASIKAVSKAGFERAFEIPFERRLGSVTVGIPTGPLAGAALPFVSETPHRSSL